jgi:hypothetical protein
MNRYLLSVYQPDGPAPPPEVMDQVMEGVGAWERELKAAGAWVFTAGLQPAGAAAVLRPEGDNVLVTDGPYAEGKEHIGGFTIIEAADLGSALEWGRKLTKATTLPTEVRQLNDAAGD